MKDRQLTYTMHARDMLTERKIPEEWVELAVFEPDRTEEGTEGTVHTSGRYRSATAESCGRF
jgi:hypothetical protein